MTTMPRTLRKIIFIVGVVMLAQGQSAVPQTAAPVLLARAVRFALGHGSADEARRLIQQSRENASKKAIATALVAIYEGKDDDARRALTPLVQGDAADDDALIELGLIEVRHGKQAEGNVWLQRVIASQSDLDTDGFLRLARAAEGLPSRNR